MTCLCIMNIDNTFGSKTICLKNIGMVFQIKFSEF